MQILLDGVPIRLTIQYLPMKQSDRYAPIIYKSATMLQSDYCTPLTQQSDHYAHITVLSLCLHVLLNIYTKLLSTGFRRQKGLQTKVFADLHHKWCQ